MSAQVIFLGRDEVLKRTGIKCKASLYRAMDRGAMVRPVRISLRSVAWLEHEVSAVVGARIAGKSTDDLRALVDRLHAQRQALAS